jgi:hypothetical protein
MADFDFNKRSDLRISTGLKGEVSIDSVDTFREIAAEGDRELFYRFSETHGSAYGGVGAGYHGEPQSFSGWVSDQYTQRRTDGVFAPGNSLYNSVADGLIDEYANHVGVNGRLPNTAEIFQHHEDVFARNGIPGAWLGTWLPGIVKWGIGREPWDDPYEIHVSPINLPVTPDNGQVVVRNNRDGSETHSHTDPNSGVTVATRVHVDPTSGSRVGVYSTVIDPTSPLRGMTYTVTAVQNG